MKEVKEREGKGLEVQWYDKEGNATRVVQIDNITELAQYLARSCWGSPRFESNPTIWKDGRRWCYREYTPV